LIALAFCVVEGVVKKAAVETGSAAK